MASAATPIRITISKATMTTATPRWFLTRSTAPSGVFEDGAEERRSRVNLEHALALTPASREVHSFESDDWPSFLLPLSRLSDYSILITVSATIVDSSAEAGDEIGN